MAIAVRRVISDLLLAGNALSLQARRKLRIWIVAVCSLLVIPLLQSAWLPGSTVFATLKAIGVWLIVGCIIGRAWCTLYIGGRKAAELIELGPYSVSRNPLYLFSFLGAFGLGLRSGSLTMAVAFLVLAMMLFRPSIRGEELELSRKFGQAYERYKARVPRVGPRLSLWRDADALSVFPPILYRTIRDGLAFVIVMPAFEIIHWLQAADVLPVLARVP